MRRDSPAHSAADAVLARGIQGPVDEPRHQVGAHENLPVGPLGHHLVDDFAQPSCYTWSHRAATSPNEPNSAGAEYDTALPTNTRPSYFPAIEVP
jgi:hypothetical protein